MTSMEIVTTSPAYARTRVDGANSLHELPWCGKIIFRGVAENTEFTRQCENTLGIALPLAAGSCTTNEVNTCYWLGPDEWLVHCPLESLDTLQSSLQSALAGTHHAIVDVSDYYTVLSLDGPDASALLSRACPLDLHPGVFAVGTATQTRFGHASMLLHKLNDNPAYHIQVRWSFTEYVWDYLLSAMRALT